MWRDLPVSRFSYDGDEESGALETPRNGCMEVLISDVGVMLGISVFSKSWRFQPLPQVAQLLASAIVGGCSKLAVGLVVPFLVRHSSTD